MHDNFDLASEFEEAQKEFSFFGLVPPFNNN